MLVPLPEALRGAAESASGDPAPTRDASTVVVLRGGESGPEAYLLRRQPTMAFAPGMYVFPGGKTDPRDAEVSDDLWAGPGPEAFGRRLGCAPDVARALVVAAVRETFEESGVLLAGPDASTVVADVSGDAFAAARVALDAGERGFADFLREHGLVLRADLLGVWAHWITPAFEPRRYDTRFFVAVMPQGQAVGALPGEADRAAWVPLRRALEAVADGSMSMLPPTRITCIELAGLAVGEVLAASDLRDVHPIEPRLVEVDGAWFLENDLEGP